MGYRYYNYKATEFSKEDLIQFYKKQFLYFERIGLGNETRFGTEVTEKLMRCTANRLDQLIKGRKTVENMCYAERLVKIWGRHIGDIPDGEKALVNSNRSFTGDIASKFDIKDLGKENELSVTGHTDYIYVSEKHRRSVEYTIYIDRIFTAYNSEVMVAVLSHDN